MYVVMISFFFVFNAVKLKLSEVILKAIQLLPINQGFL